MTPAHLALLAIVLLACCGVGRLSLGPAPAEDERRSAIAHALVGLLVFTVCFSVVVQLGLSFSLAVSCLSALGLLGLATWGVDLVRRRQARRARVGVWLGGLLLLTLVSWLPVNMGAADPYNYAFLASTALHAEWVNVQLAGTPLLDHAGTNPLFAASRAASIALLWPWSALGWSVGPAVVAEASQWLVIVTWLLLVDLVDFGSAPPIARLLIATAGIAGFTEEAVLGGGQIGQAFGIAAATVAIWLDRCLLAGWARRLSFTLAGYAVATGYPEFLAALPLYVGCVVFLRPYRWRELILTGAAVLTGVLVAVLVTRGITVDYFLYQTSNAPGAQPLTDDPRSPLDVWRWIVLQRPFSRWLFLMLVPMTLLSLHLAVATKRVERPFGAIGVATIAGLIALLVILTWAVLRSGNPNYATFKLSGWVGPVLLVGAWATVGALRGRVKQVLAAAVLLLASYRTLGLVWWAGSLTVGYLQDASPPAEWYLRGTSSEVGCTLQLAPLPASDLIAEWAIAESAAAWRGCSIDGL